MAHRTQPRRRPGQQGRRRLDLRTLPHLSRRIDIRLDRLQEVARYVDLHYGERRIAKRDSDALRTIEAPGKLLKQIQRSINVNVVAPLWLPDSLHAYRVGRSVVTAMTPHRGRLFWWRADIKDFYPSISARRVYGMFVALGCSPDVAHLLTRLTTRRHRLPQGAPTSPGLANLYLRVSGVAARLEGLAKKHDLCVTFFGDDIILTGDRPFMGLRVHVREIIESIGLRLHTTKTQTTVVGPDTEHKALGVIVNSRGQELNVPRSYRRRLRTLLRVCQRYGAGVLIAKGITRYPRPFLLGKITFAMQINPANRNLLTELDKIAW